MNNLNELSQFFFLEAFLTVTFSFPRAEAIFDKAYCVIRNTIDARAAWRVSSPVTVLIVLTMAGFLPDSPHIYELRAGNQRFPTQDYFGSFDTKLNRLGIAILLNIDF